MRQRSQEKKSKPLKITEEIEIDLDQENQEPQEEELTERVKKPRKKKQYNIK